MIALEFDFAVVVFLFSNYSHRFRLGTRQSDSKNMGQLFHVRDCEQILCRHGRELHH
jgi:hypothetical protein